MDKESKANCLGDCDEGFQHCEKVAGGGVFAAGEKIAKGEFDAQTFDKSAIAGEK